MTVSGGLPRGSVTRSTVLRDPVLHARVADGVESGRTIDQITDELREDGHQVSRSAVGRASRAMSGVLAAKRQADQIVDALSKAGPASSDAVEGRLELLRALLVSAAARMADPEGDPPEASELRTIASALLDVERAGAMSDRRRAEAERRAVEAAARRGERAAKQQGLSPSIAAAIRQAVEGDPED